MADRFGNFIQGFWKEAAGGRAFSSINPADTGDVVGEVVPSVNPATLIYTTRAPLGVVGIITPWNFPVAIPIWKIAPALVYGNTVVFKPASVTPHCAVLITQLFEAGVLPAGVLNLV